MNLHHDTQLFSQTLRAASQHLMINLGFVEKDYWITLLLRRLSGSKYSDEAVFKGGTSLSKGYFDSLWSKLKVQYQSELSALAYRPIPDENDVAQIFIRLSQRIV